MSYTSIIYHTLDDPLNPKQLPNKYSDLHTLYPGRPMDSMDNPNRYSIQPEDPEAASEMFRDVKEKTASYGEKLEKKARKMGGGEKMTVHAVEDPSMIIEDPNLKETNMLNPDGTPLLMPVDPNLPGQRNGEFKSQGMGNNQMDGGDARKPLVENYSTTSRPGTNPGKSTSENAVSYKWILIVFAAIVMFFLAYFYATRQIDIYSF